MLHQGSYVGPFLFSALINGNGLFYLMRWIQMTYLRLIEKDGDVPLKKMQCN